MDNYSRDLWSPGQKVWYVSWNGNEREEVIEKVGIKWVTLAGDRNIRFDVKSGEIGGRGYSSTGRVYLTKQEHDVEAQRYKLWKKIYSKITGYPSHSTGLMLHDLEVIARIIGVAND